MYILLIILFAIFACNCSFFFFLSCGKIQYLFFQILHLEFAHYDYKLRGTISAKDFALSMVAAADMNHINKFLDQVDELENDPHLRDMRITFEVRFYFHNFLSPVSSLFSFITSQSLVASSGIQGLCRVAKETATIGPGSL